MNGQENALLSRAASGALLTREEIDTLSAMPLDALMHAAARRRDGAFGSCITYSRNVFIPLTHLCRNVCHYCTFAQTPARIGAAYMTIDEVLAVARAASGMGCKEALFTLGERPELRYHAASEALEAMGYGSTLEYLAEAARRVQEETGLLPHLNPGCLTADELAMLRPVSASMGLMLESTSLRLTERGQAHFGSPDKEPARRLATIEAAGEAHVPFTTGILVGIGETREERIDSLFAIRELHERHGHIQEVIVQNFRAKPGTRMASAPEPARAEYLWSIAIARLVLPVDVSLQAPPNLSDEHALGGLLDAGIDDWGGVSPLTPDFVNPEAPWPQVDLLAEATRATGKTLAERLTVYPAHVRKGAPWLHAAQLSPVLRLSDTQGFARLDDWVPGGAVPPPQADLDALAPVQAWPRNAAFDAILDRATRGLDLAAGDVARLFEARGPEFTQVCQAADNLRQAVNGDTVSYTVNRNINYTNICKYRCQFCAFAKGSNAEHLRGAPYDLDHDEIARRVEEAWACGAGEVCMQGGIHPAYDGNTYIDLCKLVKAVCPDMHIHAFSPLEVLQGARTLGLDLREFLTRLKIAGLGSLPGTAAEILVDRVRREICPDKLTTAEWVEVVEAAHAAGLNTTATIMYGHVERIEDWAEHLLLIRAVQKRSLARGAGRFTEFVPLPFVHMEAPMSLRGRSRSGPTFREAVLMHAVARLVLHPVITNIQASWPKMGPEGVKACLAAGVNDLGGTLMNESISRAAGAGHGEGMTPAQFIELAGACGRVARQRTTLYGNASNERVSVSFDAHELAPVRQTRVERKTRHQEVAAE